MIFCFGRFELDEEGGELRRDGESVPIQPKPFALLALLVRERDRVVTSDELFEALWPGVIVTPSSLTRAVSHARRAIGDTHQGEVIRSLPRRGYRFVGDVETRAHGEAAAPTAPAAAPSPAPDAGPPAGTSASGLVVGRSDTFEQLRRAFERALAGEGSLALVTGPPGIGKTLVVETFARQAADAGAFVALAHCREGEGVPAYWPLLQLLRRLLAEPDLRDCVTGVAARSREASDLLPGLEHAGARDSATPDPGSRAPEQSRFLLFDAARRALVEASRRRPLVLVIEDVQWAGAPSLRLLEHLVFELGAERLLVVATLRDAARPRAHPVDRTLALLRPHPRCLHLPLEALSRGEVAALLERTIGRPAPADLTSALYARTEGVPLFVRDTIRLLERRGDLRHPERAARRGILLPDVAVDLIRRALDGLGPGAARVVGGASVLGRQFGAARVAELAGIPRAEALDVLDEATQAGVVEAVPDDAASWRFRHALYQEAAYQALAPGERALLHHRAAELLERRHAADPDTVIAELAHHHHRGLAVGDPERAHAVALRAAQRAAAVLAFEQAAAHHEQAVAALAHAETVEPRRQLDALLALGDALRLSGDRTRRREVFSDALERARSLADAERMARAAVGLCDLSEWAPRDDDAREAVAEALAVLPDADTPERARLETRLGYLCVRTEPSEAVRIARGAAAARAAGDDDALQEALYTLHFALAGPDALVERHAIGLEMVELVERGAARETALIGTVDTASDRITLGDAAAARAWRKRAEVVAGSEPHPGMAWHLRVYDTGLALLEGRFAEVPVLAARALELGRRVEHPYAAGCHRMHVAEAAFETGDPALTERWIQPILGREVGPPHYFRAWTARVRLALGREAEARDAFEGLATHDFEDVPRNIRWTRSMVEIAQLCAELGDAARARLLVTALASIETHHAVLPVPICYGGPIRYSLARLLATDDRLDDAIALFEEACTDARSMGARPVEARILLGWGGALQRRGAKRDAAERLREARQLAEALGMAGVVAAADDRLAAR